MRALSLNSTADYICCYAAGAEDIEVSPLKKQLGNLRRIKKTVPEIYFCATIRSWINNQ